MKNKPDRVLAELSGAPPPVAVSVLVRRIVSVCVPGAGPAERVKYADADKPFSVFENSTVAPAFDAIDNVKTVINPAQTRDMPTILRSTESLEQ